MTDRFFEGTRVGRYELVTRLSIGGMAELFLARLDGLGGFKKLVALKTILPDVSHDERFRQMFLDEARLSAELSHPNLGQVFDLGQEPQGPLYLAMEFLTGRDLGAVLKACQSVGQPLPLAVTGRIIRDVCQGLHAAHSHTDGRGQPRPVIHRDVAPKNVMVTFDGAVKVIDFGIAHAFGRATRTQTGIVKGTPSYMAPEQLTGERPTVSVDVYAVGVMLHECLTGRRLFSPDSPLARFSPITPPSAIVPGLPPGLDAVVLRAIEVDPARRFRSTRDLARALSEAIPRMAEADDLAEVMQALFPGQRASLSALSESASQGDPSQDQLAEVARSGAYPVAALTRSEKLRQSETEASPSPVEHSRAHEPPAVPLAPRATTVPEGLRATETGAVARSLPPGWPWAAAVVVTGAMALATASALTSGDEAPSGAPRDRPAPSELSTRVAAAVASDTSPEAEARLVADARALVAALKTDDAELLLRQCTRAGKPCPAARELIEQLHDERGAARLLKHARDALGREDLLTASTMLEAAKGTKLFAMAHDALTAELEAKRPSVAQTPEAAALMTSQALMRKGDYLAAEQALLDCRQGSAECPAARAMLADVRKERRYALALDMAARALETGALDEASKALESAQPTMYQRERFNAVEAGLRRAREVQHDLRFSATRPVARAETPEEVVSRLIEVARAAKKEQNVTVALKALEECLRRAPNNPTCILMLGSTYALRAELGGTAQDMDEARAYYQRFLEVAPADDARRARVEALLKGIP